MGLATGQGRRLSALIRSGDDLLGHAQGVERLEIDLDSGLQGELRVEGLRQLHALGVESRPRPRSTVAVTRT